MPDLELSVGEFVDLFNQTLEFAYPRLFINGELSNFRVSKNKWVYFDLKDSDASVHFFGTVYNLPGPLEDGMQLKVLASPYLHRQYGFSLNVHNIQFSGQGTIKQAQKLLEEKLTKEGLFDETRKRSIVYPAKNIGLITSSESAAYSDFIKIINDRWVGSTIYLNDVQVQGELAEGQIIAAINWLNQHNQELDVIVITRGGGSLDDLQVFNNENLVRSIAGSRIPTLVAIGHERDYSLAEAAADKRASTPTNAAQILVPDKKDVNRRLDEIRIMMDEDFRDYLTMIEREIDDQKGDLSESIDKLLASTSDKLAINEKIIALLDPNAPLKRGYALVRDANRLIIRSVRQVKKDDIVDIDFSDGELLTLVKDKIIRGKKYR
ncbi:MAG TPA: exodeoxyribonuclease VII large subunit [Candidatus Saccharimonadales bacterium]|nr:exodeoxyribonuclease VII large subunit [Candidatus Saccharimonadales bacterium]